MGSVSSDPQTIKQALVDTGPLAVAIGIGSDYGGYWDGDIYRCTTETGINHGVAIVGYDDAGGYWWVRNSWGTGWGEDGYFKLGYGECLVEDYVMYADVVNQCSDLHEPNDTPGDATPVSYGATLSDVDICPAGDVDYYSLAGDAGDVILVDIDAGSLSPASTLNSDLFLYDTDGLTELAHNDDYDGVDSYISYELPADGTYYLMVREYNHPNEGGAAYFYHMSLDLGTIGPLTYAGHTVDDDASGESSGNGDGVVDCGETIELYIDLRNEGTIAATDVEAQITTGDPYVTFSGSTLSGYPDIPAGGTATNLDDYEFDVATDTPDGHVIQFDVSATVAGPQGPWDDALEVTVACQPVTCGADIDRDGDVDILDIQFVADRWRQLADPPYDVDGDGFVTVVDIMRVAAEWGPCP
jgi:hypothetical protein